MITSVISSAARLSLAPARLAGRIGGSLLRELRGNGAADARPAPSPARAKPAARTRANSKPRRGAAAIRARAQPKRGAARTRARPQPKAPATRTGAQARPKRAPRRKPLDDVAIARKIESTIFRGVDVDKGKVDVNVAEGVVWLRGEVRTPDLINELEARAARVTEVRRVENMLHPPEAAAPGRTDTLAPQPETGSSAARPADRAVRPGETSEEAPPPASGRGTRNSDAHGKGRGPAPVGSASGGLDFAAGSPYGDEHARREGPDIAELDKDPDRDDPAGQEGPDMVELDKDPDGDESAGQEGPDVGELENDPEGDRSAGQDRDLAELDNDPDGDEPAGREGPEMAELDKGQAHQPNAPGLRGL
jgi:hypothetical protein